MIQEKLFEKPPDLRKIARFRGRWGFLHNFYVEPDGTTVEREYQAAKCANPADAAKFADLGARAAKDLGQLIKIRPDWEQVKVPIMHLLLLWKFNPYLYPDNWKLLDADRIALDEPGIQKSSIDRVVLAAN